MSNFTMCTKCKKRPAELFISTTQEDGTAPAGICLTCAMELGDGFLEKMGISKDELKDMSEEMSEVMKNMSEEEFNQAVNDSMEFMKTMDVNPEKTENLYNLEENTSLSEIAKKLVSRNEEKKEEDDSPTTNNFFDSISKPEPSKKDKKKPEKKLKHLNNYAENLTTKAKRGKIDKIVGRKREISRAIQILNRRSKNNPCLIGEPGVGKTAIAEGLALDIANGDVPYRLQKKEVYQLDLTALVAGTQFRGQFESRVKGLLEEVKQAGNIILFVDEVHNLVGAGESEGAMNAANIFKPALSRGEIQVMGATTFTEYRKYIEKDTALERRFQPITVEEPSIGESIEVLEGIKGYYESYHRVKISDAVIRSAVLLSEKYIHDRFLPDKAIDLIDEAASARSLASKELEAYDNHSAGLKHLNTELEELEISDEKDYEKIAVLKADIINKESEVENYKRKIENIPVTNGDIANVIELWTGIDAKKIEESDFSKVAELESRLKRRVVGQDNACKLVANAIKRHQVQITARPRPASFIFVGPTAVGKTELVKVLADELFDTPEPLIRIDMSEYMEEHSVSKIVGSPPGYVGYDEAGQLTEQVRRKPYSIILFDEIEKAHPNVLNILLQILDEGHIKDSHGRKISFKNTVIVMTSNAGSQFADSSLGFGKSKEELSEEKVLNSLREFLRPEFIGRVDEIVVFSPLTKENYVDIADLMISEMKDPLKEQGIVLVYSRAVCEYLAKKAFGQKTGAREIRHIIRREVEDGIATLIIDNADKFSSHINLDAKNGKLLIN